MLSPAHRSKHSHLSHSSPLSWLSISHRLFLSMRLSMRPYCIQLIVEYATQKVYITCGYRSQKSKARRYYSLRVIASKGKRLTELEHRTSPFRPIQSLYKTTWKYRALYHTDNVSVILSVSAFLSIIKVEIGSPSVRDHQ